MRTQLGLSLATAALASAASIPAPAPAAVPAKRQEATSKILVGAPGQILLADFDGSEFEFVANSTLPGTTASWMAFKEPNLLFAVDENSNQLRLFTLDPATNELSAEPTVVAEGAAGIVHLEFNADKTRLVGSSFSDGVIDIWDISENTLTFVKNITSEEELGPHERQDTPRCHQSILDPSGRFFLTADLGTDSILITDSADDAFELVNVVRVPTAGCGPRHGAFIPSAEDPTRASHYAVVCEIANLVEFFAVTYDEEKGLDLTPAQPALSTFGTPTNSSTAAAGAIEVSADGRDVYVSNRLTGDEADSIAHFRVVAGSDCAGGASLEFDELVSSFGEIPRMFSLSSDESLLFSSNQAGGLGLLALTRNPSDGALRRRHISRKKRQADVGGRLGESPVASVDVEVFGDVGFGPQFVLQIA